MTGSLDRVEIAVVLYRSGKPSSAVAPPRTPRGARDGPLALDRSARQRVRHDAATRVNGTRPCRVRGESSRGDAGSLTRCRCTPATRILCRTDVKRGDGSIECSYPTRRFDTGGWHRALDATGRRSTTAPGCARSNRPLRLPTDEHIGVASRAPRGGPNASARTSTRRGCFRWASGGERRGHPGSMTRYRLRRCDASPRFAERGHEPARMVVFRLPEWVPGDDDARTELHRRAAQYRCPLRRRCPVIACFKPSPSPSPCRRSRRPPGA